MFGVMLSRYEFSATIREDELLQSLAQIMRARGFSMLGVVAMNEEDGSLITLGDAETTQGAEFAAILRCLADQIEENLAEPEDMPIVASA